MAGGGKPRPYGFYLTSGKNVGATLVVARKGSPLEGAVTRSVTEGGSAASAPNLPPYRHLLRKCHLPLQGEAGRLQFEVQHPK